MNHKVLGSVFVLAVTLGMISVAVRSPQATPTLPPAAVAPVDPTAPKTATAPLRMDKNTPHMDRALASYRVYEYGIERGMDFRGAGYNARISESEIRFGTAEGSLLLGAPKFEQGSKAIGCADASFVHPAFGVARLERGPVTEEYLFENRRMEQLFRIPAPMGVGALKVSVPLQTTFPSVIENRVPGSGKFDAVEFANGGVAVLDPTGELKFSCTGAVAWDAAKNRITLCPSHENGAIVMEVPASFMAKAAYPVVIDPWFGINGSNTGGGISNSAHTSNRPSFKDNLIAWADNTSGNFEIYAKIWNGVEFAELGGSATGGGVSATPTDSVNPSVAANGQNSPTIAWEEGAGGGSIFLKQFPLLAAGGTWAGVGAPTPILV